MKKIFSIISLVLMFACCNFALTSCSSDDDDDDNDNDVDGVVIKNLVGTWKDTTYVPGLEYGFTFNADGTYLYYSKFITPNTDDGTVLDEEGCMLKHKGTYIVSEDKLELTLKQEYGCYPTRRKNPDAEWEEDVRTGTSTIEWIDSNVILFHPNDDMPDLKLQKVK